MKTKKFLTSLAAAVMLSAGLAGSGIAMSQPAQTVQAAANGQVALKVPTVTGTIKNDNVHVFGAQSGATNIQTVNFVKYTKGQNVQILFQVVLPGKTQSGQSVNVPMYMLGTQTNNGQTYAILVQQSDITASGTVPTQEQFNATMQNNKQTVQNAYANAYKNRTLKYIRATPKSKKGARIYNLYLVGKKHKKRYYFKATKSKIKHGKKVKSVHINKKSPAVIMVTKQGKFLYIGKKRFLKTSTLKMTYKYTPIRIPDNVKALLTDAN